MAGKMAAVDDLTEAQLAHEGMRLLLCSQLKEAEAIFSKYRGVSARLHAGHSFTMFIRAVMNFEDESLEAAYNALEGTEKFCDVETSLFSSSEHREAVSRLSPHDKLLRRAIAADCLLLEAVTVFLRQSLTSYVKGGYIIRKAWKQYEGVVKDLEQVCHTPSPLAQLVKKAASEPQEKESSKSHDSQVTKEPLHERMPHSTEEDGLLVQPPSTGPPQATVDGVRVDQPPAVHSLASTSPIQYLDHPDNRLRAAVYFGYGMMNVCLSLIPPKLLKLANLLGFHGDRALGIQALEFCNQSQDMKAPLARLFLLWYHTIIRHFFALDGPQQDAGCDEATHILEEGLQQYPGSAIFLYFRGKVHYLRGDLVQAQVAYDFAASSCQEQREVEHICLYEKGWVHFLQLQWDSALPCFIRLKNETKWSACYYGYLSAIVTGLTGDLPKSRELFLQCGKLVKRKNNNLEKFCARRGLLYKRGETALMTAEVMLMAVEVVYLWRALPCCPQSIKEELLERLEALQMSDAKPFHLALLSLMKGAILVDLDQGDRAERLLRDTLRHEEDLRQDKHILAFALYEMAMLQTRAGQYARARRMLYQAKDSYSGYEFEARVNFKVHAALNDIDLAAELQKGTEQ